MSEVLAPQPQPAFTKVEHPASKEAPTTTADRASRGLAVLVDCALLWLCFVPGYAMSVVAANDIPTAPILRNWLISQAVMYLLPMGFGIYQIYRFCSSGQTIAKRWFCVRVCNLLGGEASWIQLAVVRPLPALLILTLSRQAGQPRKASTYGAGRAASHLLAGASPGY